MELLKATALTKKAASQDRKAPFSVLVYGGSSVGKSNFTKQLFYSFGKTFDLPTSAEYRYVRNPNDDFWSGFNTSQWCIQLDDIAYQNPQKALQGDPTVLEMLQVVNNVPFVPNQADLADKGRTPVRAELVVATSNSETLNAHAYFNCPLAVQRRLPYVFEIAPKEEYKKDSVFLNSESLPVLEKDGEVWDYWIIKVKKVVPAGDSILNQRVHLEVVHTYDNIYDFLQWFNKTAFEYRQLQAQLS